MEKKLFSVGVVEVETIERFQKLQEKLFPGKYGKFKNAELFEKLIELGEKEAEKQENIK